MSLKGELYVRQGVTRAVLVFSKDSALVKSIADTLKQHMDSEIERDYEVVHRSSVSRLGQTVTAAVLDIDMLGSDIDRIRRNVRRIVDDSPQCPIFLVGKKADLAAAIQDAEIHQSVSRTFSKPMLGPQILTALNLVRQEICPTVHKTSSRVSQGAISVAVVGVSLIAILAGWLWQDTEYDLFAATQEASTVSMTEQAAQLLPERTLPERTLPESSSLDESDVAGTERVLDELQGKVTDVSQFRSPADSPLFNQAASILLDEARQALKRGYILGPENVNALHFYRQALIIDPYNQQANQRIQTVIDELKYEFSLAIDQSKPGRSNSILKIVTELDPFNDALPAMRQRHARTFSSN